MIKIKSVKRRKLEAPVLTEYVHGQLRRLWRDSIREFVTKTAEELGKYRSSGTAPYGNRTPMVETGMTISVLQPLASHTEKGGSIGLGRLIQSWVVAFSREATIEFKRQNQHLDLTRKRAKGREAGSAYELDFGTPENIRVKFEFDLPKISQTVQQINRHEHLEQSFEVGAKAMASYFRRNLKNYIKNKELINYLQLGRRPNAR